MTAVQKKILVISDIHGNKTALDAVMADAGVVDAIWVLGDTLDYGPDSKDCLLWVRDHADVLLGGNHEQIAQLLIEDPSRSVRLPATFAALPAIIETLTPGLKTLVAGLTPTAMPREDILLCHGSPAGHWDDYIETPQDAFAAFKAMDAGVRLCFHGHTHAPVCVSLEDDGTKCYVRPADYNHALIVGQRDYQWLINVGSVGQPRDGDPRASYCLYNPARGTVTLRRVPYDIAATQARISRLGYPGFFAERLAKGI